METTSLFIIHLNWWLAIFTHRHRLLATERFCNYFSIFTSVFFAVFGNPRFTILKKKKNRNIECIQYLIRIIFRIDLISSKFDAFKENCLIICQDLLNTSNSNNSNTFRGGVRNKQSTEGVVATLAVAVLLFAVVMMAVVEGDGVVD